jgi:hypothetical protein
MINTKVWRPAEGMASAAAQRLARSCWCLGAGGGGCGEGIGERWLCWQGCRAPGRAGKLPGSVSSTGLTLVPVTVASRRRLPPLLPHPPSPPYPTPTPGWLRAGARGGHEHLLRQPGGRAADGRRGRPGAAHHPPRAHAAAVHGHHDRTPRGAAAAGWVLGLVAFGWDAPGLVCGSCGPWGRGSAGAPGLLQQVTQMPSGSRPLGLPPSRCLGQPGQHPG